MNLVTGEIIEVYHNNGLRMARIRVGGAITCVALAVVPDAHAGDIVLAHAGVALTVVRKPAASAVRETTAAAKEV